MEAQGVVRRATHAGSWYTDSARRLEQSFEEWLKKADIATPNNTRAIIGPHAGYSYCGHIGAFCYKALQTCKPKRVFLLGPSHHYFTRRCCLSRCDEYETPIGPLPIDRGIYSELQETGLFDEMPVDVDEAEHSLELHAPYIRHVFKGQNITLVPIMVGSLTPETEARYGAALAHYLQDPDNVFVISSDFCHWGRRFSYTPYDKGSGEIFEFIEDMDRRGMKTIESLDPAQFTAYLRETKNTICGRHPIGVLMQMVKANQDSRYSCQWLKYDQSSHCRNMSDSSVSYAAGIIHAV